MPQKPSVFQDEEIFGLSSINYRYSLPGVLPLRVGWRLPAAAAFSLNKEEKKR
jgi:hypothetical protein